MHITMITLGSRGDVQPYAALGQALTRNGHTVRIATHAIFEPFIRGLGLDFHDIGGDPQPFLERMTQADMGANLLMFFRFLYEWAVEFAEEALQAFTDSVADADLLLYGFLGIAAHHAAEKRGIPAVITTLMPAYAPTAVYPSINAPIPRDLGKYYNRFSHMAENMATHWTFYRMFNRYRTQSLGLPDMPLTRFPYFQSSAQPNQPTPHLLAYSRYVIPPPPDWGTYRQVTGYWFLDVPDYQPDARLRAFLDAGAPPIYIGFGSLITRDPDAMLDLVMSALRMAGQRGILLTGWGGWQQRTLSDDVLIVDSVPHDWLFPQMAAVMHHGGAGTTAAGFRAGVPSIIVPFFGDQPYWARLATQLGVAPQPILPRELTAERLAQAFTQAVTDTHMRANAARLGEKIRAENGLGQAVAAIERIYAESGRVTASL